MKRFIAASAGIRKARVIPGFRTAQTTANATKQPEWLLTLHATRLKTMAVCWLLKFTGHTSKNLNGAQHEQRMESRGLV